MTKLTRAWINQPSTFQPLHKYDGSNVLLVGEDVQKGGKVYFTSGDVVSMEVPAHVLSTGWTKRCCCDR